MRRDVVQPSACVASILRRYPEERFRCACAVLCCSDNPETHRRHRHILPPPRPRWRQRLSASIFCSISLRSMKLMCARLSWWTCSTGITSFPWRLEVTPAAHLAWCLPLPLCLLLALAVTISALSQLANSLSSPAVTE